MLLSLLKSKILRAKVTQANVRYEGSLALDLRWMETLGILPYEKLLLGNISNGERLETYAMVAPSGSGTVALNGAAARLGKTGDLIVVMAFAHMDREEAKTHQAKILVMDTEGRPEKAVGFSLEKLHV